MHRLHSRTRHTTRARTRTQGTRTQGRQGTQLPCGRWPRFVTLCTEEEYLEETIGTLRFAVRTKAVRVPARPLPTLVEPAQQLQPGEGVEQLQHELMEVKRQLEEKQRLLQDSQRQLASPQQAEAGSIMRGAAQSQHQMVSFAAAVVAASALAAGAVLLGRLVRRV